MKPVNPAGPRGKKRKGKGTSERTLIQCRKLGWIAQKVEHWNPHAFRRVDLFGCIDIIALDGAPGVLGIQATSRGEAAAHVRKIREECAEAVQAWLECGARMQVWGWRMTLTPGGAVRWDYQIRHITLVEGDSE